MSKLETITIDTPSGSNTMQIGSTNTATINLGVSGDTINVPAGVTIANAGTATGFGGVNTPNFLATKNASQTGLTDNTYTKISFGSELFDTDSAYDASNSRFTVPSGKAGKYIIFAGVNMEADTANTGDTFELIIYLNGSAYKAGLLRFPGNPGSRFDQKFSTIVNLSVGDYIELYGRVDTTSGSFNMYAGSSSAQFGGFRIIE